MRLEPFASLNYELQSQTFDNPDRLFDNIIE